MQRRDACAATLLGHPGLVLDYALFVMIDDRHSSFSAYGSTIRAHPPQDPVSGQQPETRARRYLAEAHERSEEHTSELQSLMRISYAVFCLKKKKAKEKDTSKNKYENNNNMIS